jgi:ketosteroid isomerase-like protein
MPAAEKELVDRYLTRYKDGDLDGMYACLDSNFTFTDPAFVDLDGQSAGYHRIFPLKYSLAHAHSPPREGYVCHVCQESSRQ